MSYRIYLPKVLYVTCISLFLVVNTGHAQRVSQNNQSYIFKQELFEEQLLQVKLSIQELSDLLDSMIEQEAESSGADGDTEKQ